MSDSNQPQRKPEILSIGGMPSSDGSGKPGSAMTPEEIARKASGRATWHRKASKPVSVWMFLLFITLFVHRWIPNSIWLMVHMVTLGLITNSILIWSQHFTEALLKIKLDDSDRPVQVRRIYFLNASFVVLIAGIVGALYPLTIIGSAGVGLAVVWHALSLLKQFRQALPSRFGATVKYYIAASCLLPVGATLGAILAHDGNSVAMHNQLLVAHEAVNILGFVGITVVGTLITLWPTMLRTKMHPDAMKISVRALALMCAAIAIIFFAALFGQRFIAGAGFMLYALALVYVLGLMVRTCTAKKPTEYTTASVLMAVTWLLVAVIWAGSLLFTTRFGVVNLRPITPVFAAGFLLQLLLGAMSYLLPVRMGGGPAAVRAANKEFNRFALGRVFIINLCVLIFALPATWTGTWIRAGVSLLGAFTFAAFIPLMLRGVKKSVAARKEVIAARARGELPKSNGPQGMQPEPRNLRRELIFGALAVAGVSALGKGVDVAQNGWNFASGSAAAGTGETTTVQVKMTSAMRFEPAEVQVPAGNKLVIELTNADDKNVHDLVLENGVTSGRLDPGATTRVDAGVISSDVTGWCSIIGHKQMGMVFKATATGAQNSSVASAGSSNSSSVMKGSDIDVMSGTSSKDFKPRDAVLAPVEAGEQVNGQNVRKYTFDVEDIQHEVAPGVSVNAWTYNGTYMGPTLRGNVGDIFEITLKNSGTMTHSIDFHAGMVSPDQNMKAVAPGETLTYRYEATGAGVWLYHCSTMPMTVHMAAGMFGAVVINPADLADVDREYIVVQNDIYLTDTGKTADNGDKLTDISPEGIEAGVPTLTMFNGNATQYREHPLPAKVGEKVRIWLLAAGPSKGMSFHVVGTQFHTVYKEGAYSLKDGADAFGVAGGHAQALDLSSAQGGFVEMEFLEAGSYAFVNHDFTELERGAKGIIKVTA